jgi:protein involved in polysaccharide export with SLBB domain
MKKILRIFILINLLLVMAFSQTYGKRFQLDDNMKEDQEKEQEDLLLRQQQEQTRQKMISQEVLLDKAIDPQEYKVGPGDGFSVVIETGKTLNYTVQVTPTGKLLIPTVGVLDVNKMTLDEVIKKAEKEILQTYKNSQSNLALIKVRRFKVQISGAVRNPGFYEVTPVTRLDEIIDDSNGLHPFARDFAIKVIRQNGDEEIINYLDYLRTGNLDLNPTFMEGDKIIVPYGEVEKEGVLIRGAVERTGYDLIEEKETIEDYIKRGFNFNEDIELSKVYVERKDENIEISPQDFNSFVIKPQDQLNFVSVRGVAVNGFVQAPGGYQYIPGYTCSDYIGLAGGNTVQGDIDRVRVRHMNGQIEKGLQVKINPGDVIIVPRSRKNIFFGESSVLGIITSVASLYLTYIAATK